MAQVHPVQHNHQSNGDLPLQLQALIRGQRSSAIIMAILAFLSIYFIPWAIFYIVMATQLNPRRLPNRGLIKGAAIATLPLCLGLIPIIIDIEFWKFNSRLKEYEERGSEAFISDQEFLAGEPKRKRGQIIAWSVLGAAVAVITILVTVAIVTSSNHGSTDDASSLLTDQAKMPYVSSEHGFTVNFPGFPSTEHSTLDVKGVSVPYTYYSKETNDGATSYAVQVAQYPESDFAVAGQERGVLDGAINGVARGEGTTLLTSSNDGTFNGYPSAQSTFSVTRGGQTYDMYILAFVKGNDMFMLMTIGETEAGFNDFIESFKFN